MKKILFLFATILCASSGLAAPVVVVPGDAASYMYFPAGASAPAASASATAEPIGFIGMFPALPLPDGWLECSGAVVSSADYPELVEHLAGASATSAALPDLRSEFLRGLDNGRGLDAGRTLMSVQTGQNLWHVHTVSAVTTTGDHSHSISLDAIGHHSHSLSGSQFVSTQLDSNHLDRTGPSYVTNNPSTTTSGGHSHSIATVAAGDHGHTLSVAASGGTEVRPRNVAIVFAIKAQ